MLDCCIDVSDAQGINIDWAKVRVAGGILLAFIKIMEGAALGYSTWAPQSTGARAVGIMVVPYVFLRPTTTPAIIAANLIRAAELTQGSPFALDWEGRAAATCTAAQVELIGGQVGAVTSRKPVGYWGNPGATPATPTPAMANWDRWVPRYPQLPQPASYAELRPINAVKVPPNAMFWQYTSAGVVPGIGGPVDRSVWLGTAEQLTAWFETGARL